MSEKMYRIILSIKDGKVWLDCISNCYGCAYVKDNKGGELTCPFVNEVCGMGNFDYPIPNFCPFPTPIDALKCCLKGVESASDHIKSCIADELKGMSA